MLTAVNALPFANGPTPCSKVHEQQHVEKYSGKEVDGGGDDGSSKTVVIELCRCRSIYIALSSFLCPPAKRALTEIMVLEHLIDRQCCGHTTEAKFAH